MEEETVKPMSQQELKANVTRTVRRIRNKKQKMARDVQTARGSTGTYTRPFSLLAEGAQAPHHASEPTQEPAGSRKGMKRLVLRVRSARGSTKGLTRAPNSTKRLVTRSSAARREPQAKVEYKTTGATRKKRDEELRSAAEVVAKQ